MTDQANCTCITEARGVELRSKAELDDEIGQCWTRLIALLRKAGYKADAYGEQCALEDWRDGPDPASQPAPAQPAEAGA
jgi:hypothetical protein